MYSGSGLVAFGVLGADLVGSSGCASNAELKVLSEEAVWGSEMLSRPAKLPFGFFNASCTSPTCGCCFTTSSIAAAKGFFTSRATLRMTSN